MTAIVGPNGCGKSNVGRRRWVLANNARALRGARWKRSSSRPSARRSVNIAEVSLHFDNDDGSLHAPYRGRDHTAVVAFRRERVPAQPRPCRLRDIHDLVRGTGLGADSGVVIEARMIDALLSDRPDDRRELFEEAAGVGLYRDRRRTTERRLEETGTDLARLDDLIAEVQSKVRSLARQSKKAERHGELTRRRFTVELLAGREMAAWRRNWGSRGALLAARISRRSTSWCARRRRREDGHSRRVTAEAQRAD